MSPRDMIAGVLLSPVIPDSPRRGPIRIIPLRFRVRALHARPGMTNNDGRLARFVPMTPPTIRPARPEEYDEIARVWMNSFCSTGLEEASNFLLAKLRARVRMEIENGWSLF